MKEKQEEVSLEVEFSIDEEKFGNSIKLKRETEFFKEESHVKHDVISIKRQDKKNITSWNIMLNKKPAFTLTSDKFSKKEQRYLGSVEGLGFMISSFRDGVKAVSEFKKRMKGKL